MTKEYNSIDIMKLISAVVIVVIHSELSLDFLSPLFRMAVPLFFIVSSYFFFSKNRRSESKAEKRNALLHFVKRNIFLYLFWTAVQTPVLLYTEAYYKDFFFQGLKDYLYDLLIGHGFTGSWFIFSLVIGVLIHYLWSDKISPYLPVIVTLPLYLIACISTNYSHLFSDNSLLLRLTDGFYSGTGMFFHNSFPVGIFWVSVGRLLAYKEREFQTSKTAILGILSLITVYIEYCFITENHWASYDDCYLSLIGLSIAAFVLVKRIDFRVKTSFRIRELSIIIYVIHGCCGRIIGFVLKKIPISPDLREIFKVAAVFAVAAVLLQLLALLREKKNIKLLKYAY